MQDRRLPGVLRELHLDRELIRRDGVERLDRPCQQQVVRAQLERPQPLGGVVHDAPA